MQQFRQIRYDYGHTSNKEIEAVLREFQQSLRGAKTCIYAAKFCVLNSGVGEEAALVYEVSEPKIHWNDKGRTERILTNVLLWPKKEVTHCPCQIGTPNGQAILCVHIAATLSQFAVDQTAIKVADAAEIERLDVEAERDYKKRQHDKILLAEVTQGMSFSRKIAAENRLKFLKAWQAKRTQKLPF